MSITIAVLWHRDRSRPFATFCSTVWQISSRFCSKSSFRLERRSQGISRHWPRNSSWISIIRICIWSKWGSRSSSILWRTCWSILKAWGTLITGNWSTLSSNPCYSRWLRSPDTRASFSSRVIWISRGCCWWEMTTRKSTGISRGKCIISRSKRILLIPQTSFTWTEAKEVLFYELGL